MLTVPNSLVVGAAKSGPTSLYQYLRQHLQVLMSGIEEADDPRRLPKRAARDGLS
jgi:hypothetical protein